MSRLDTLVEDQNKIWNHMQETQRAVEKDGWTAELRESWDKDEERLTEVSGDIERAERAAKLAHVDLRQVVDTGAPAEVKPADDGEQRKAAYRGAFDKYIRRGMGTLSQDQQALMERHFEGEETRAQGEGVDAAGGYLVPDEFSTAIREAIKSFGGILNLATVINTSGGNTLQWPTNDDTANVGAILGENTQITEQDLTFGTQGIGSYTYTSKLVRVSWQLLNDSAFALEPFLARKLGERIGRAMAAHAVSGTGSGQPAGLITGLTTGVTGTGTSAISYDNLVDLEHTIDPAYRPNARYVLSDGALKVLRKLKDADGRPLFQPVPAPGFPATINGNPYTIENSMATPGASAKTIVYGDIAEAYLVRMVQGIQMVVMRERYADFLQSGFFSFARMDAMVVNPAAATVFAHAAS